MTDTPTRLISFVIPVYNEEPSLRQLVGEILTNMKQMEEFRAEIILIDDGSTDGSWQTITELSSSLAEVRGLRFLRNYGKAAALQAGFTKAQGSLVFTLDADLQDNPSEIPNFLKLLQSGPYDLISGYKQVRHDPWYKVFPSRVFNGMISRLTGVKLHDHNCGYKLYKAEVCKAVRLYGELHRFVPVLATAAGYRVGEMVVNHRPRQHGHSKFGWQRYIKGFLDLLQVAAITQYRWRPMHFFGGVGVIGVSVAMGLAFLYLLLRLFSSLPSDLLLLAILPVGTLGLVSFHFGFLAEWQIVNSPLQHQLCYDIAEYTPNAVE